MNRPTLVVKNVLINDQDDQVLLGLRADKNLWELPGGKVEDESYVDAAVREQEEETGMELVGTPRLVGCVDAFGFYDPKIRFVELILFWEYWRGVPVREEPTKQLEWRWVPLDQVLDLPLTPSTRVFAESILPSLCPGCIQVDPC